MKNFFRDILKNILQWLAKKTILRYQPGIVAITGSAGKTSTKEAIRAVLSRERFLRVSAGNLNNELGMPLTVLGDWSEAELKLISREQPAGKKRIKKSFFWLKVIVLGFYRLFFAPAAAYPEMLVLEYGADKPGDIKRLLEIGRPQIAVVTAVGRIPVHVEFYAGPESVAREKARLVEQLPTAGFAVLNADDNLVCEMKSRTRAQIMTFGFDEKAQLKISNFEDFFRDGQPVGTMFKLEYGGSFVPVKIEGVLGKGVAYASAAAASVGLIFGVNLVKIAEALSENFKPPRHRMNLLRGIKDTLIIDDSYNASLLSMRLALEELRSLKVKRKIAILGDMLEIGSYSEEAHREIGILSASIVDLLFTVGPGGQIIAESGRQAGFPKEKIFSFVDAKEAAPQILSKIRAGDLILVKASRSIGLDKIVEEIKDRENEKI